MEDPDRRGCLLGSHPHRQACAAGAPTPGPAQGCCEDPHPHPPVTISRPGVAACLAVSGVSAQRPVKEPFHAHPRHPWLPSGPSKTNSPRPTGLGPASELPAHGAPLPNARPATCRSPASGAPGTSPSPGVVGFGGLGWSGLWGCHPGCGDLGGVGEAGAVAEWRQTTRQCPSLAGPWGLGLAGGAGGGGSVWPGRGVCPNLPPHRARAQQSERPAVILCRGPLTVAQPFRG